MDTGHAESAPETNDLAGLASFLDQPETESVEEDDAETADEPTSEEADTGEEANDDSDESDTDDVEEDAPPVETKVTFKVKNADGVEETVEATTEEIAKSYMRQQDYSRKTQELSKREDEAVTFLRTKHEEMRQGYLSQAEIAQTAVIQMAGLKTGDEMAQLAHSDPAAWVAENQRQQSINNYLNSLNQQIEGEKQRAVQEQQQMQAKTLQQQYQKTWEVLAAEKIDKPTLAKIYEGVGKSYGFSEQELGNVYDHRLVKMMRDAQAYQELKSKKSEVTKKVTDAPRMPSKQTVNHSPRNQQLENKFKSGRAKLNDLAALLR